MYMLDKAFGQGTQQFGAQSQAAEWTGDGGVLGESDRRSVAALQRRWSVELGEYRLWAHVANQAVHPGIKAKTLKNVLWEVHQIPKEEYESRHAVSCGWPHTATRSGSRAPPRAMAERSVRDEDMTGACKPFNLENAEQITGARWLVLFWAKGEDAASAAAASSAAFRNSFFPTLR